MLRLFNEHPKEFKTPTSTPAMKAKITLEKIQNFPSDTKPLESKLKLAGTGMPSEIEYCAFFNKTKHAEYNFLSNFHEQPVVSPEHGTFKCSEGLYQFLKFAYLNDDELKKQFLAADGQTAYNLSRELAKKTDPNWDRVKAMRRILKHLA